MDTLSVSEISEHLRRAGVTPTYASMLAHGKRVPSLILAVKIEDDTGIPPRFWIKRNEVSQDQDGEATLNDNEFSGAGHE